MVCSFTLPICLPAGRQGVLTGYVPSKSTSPSQQKFKNELKMERENGDHEK
jgi:hypothetical protein